MVKEPNGDQKNKKTSKEGTQKDMLLHLMELVATEDFTRDELQELIDAAEGIASKRKPQPDSD